MTHKQNNTDNQAAFHAQEPTERKIGNTTYIVRVYFKPNAREGLADKLWRLIRNDGSSL
jgi:hypothetical protein